MKLFLLKFGLAGLLGCGLLFRANSQTAGQANASGPGTAFPSAASTNSTPAVGHDDPAYRLKQRHRLAAMITVLLVVAAWYAVRKPKNSPPGARND